jgi:alkylation response protein AidB-like acyl-CoA dehydrogenase
VDFSATEAQSDLAELTRSILKRGSSGPVWTSLAEAGVLAAALPVSVGGAGYGLLEQCAVLVELGAEEIDVPYLPSITVAASAIAEFGTPRQRDRWVRPAATGELVLTAALAEEVGDDPEKPLTRAEFDGTGWRLSGAKTTVDAAVAADLFLVPAHAGDGVAVFLVTPRDPGVTVRPQEVVDGGDAAALELDGVYLGNDRLLGEIGHGPRIAAWLDDRDVIGRCARQLGVTERALEVTARYAGERVQFDRPIGTFQAVAQRLADAYVDVEAIRLTLWQAAWRLAEGLPARTEVATAKFWAADGGHRVAHTMVHIHGGVGIDKQYPPHRYFVAAKRNEFSMGGATAQLRRIGSVLAAEPV